MRVRSVAGLLLLVEGVAEEIGEDEATGEISPEGPVEA